MPGIGVPDLMNETAIHRGIYNCPNCGAGAAPDSVRCAYCNSTLATRVCPSCYGAIFAGMTHCPACGVKSSAGDTPRPQVLECPRCAVGLVLVELSGRALRECEQCGGLWVERDTLQAICTDQENQEAVISFDFVPRAVDKIRKGTRVYVPCPECGKLMNRNNFAGCSGVVVDWCKAHGTWFDQNELRRIVLFIRDGGLKKARERERAKLAEEKMHLREEQRTLTRLSRLAGDSPGTAPGADSDPLFRILAGIWRRLPH